MAQGRVKKLLQFYAGRGLLRSLKWCDHIIKHFNFWDLCEKLIKKYTQRTFQTELPSWMEAVRVKRAGLLQEISTEELACSTQEQDELLEKLCMMEMLYMMTTQSITMPKLTPQFSLRLAKQEL
jgi:hypothetical protein